MKNIAIVFAMVASFSSMAGDNCRAKALAVGKAVDKVYTPKLAKDTRISVTNTDTSETSYTWLVNFYVPNAGGQTAYTIEMQKESCEIINLSQISE
jgi:hypothetical protein